MEVIQRIGFEKQPDRQAVEDAVIEAVQSDPERFFRAYVADARSYGGRYVSADLFKEQFPWFNESAESRNRYNRPVHNAASVLASEQYRRVIANSSEPWRDRVIFLTGVPGAGKTTSVLQDKNFPADCRVLFEGQLSRPGTAITKIQQALDAGLKPKIAAIHVLPEDALAATLRRFNEFGRGAGINVMADIQGRLPDGLREVHARFGDRVELFIADNRDQDHPKTFKGWDNIGVLQSEGNHERIRQRLEDALERQRGHLGEAAYRQARGLAPLDSVHDRSMAPEYDGGVQAPAQRRSLPERSGEAPILTEGEERLQIARAVAEKVVDGLARKDDRTR
jgi:hypothetical protein